MLETKSKKLEGNAVEVTVTISAEEVNDEVKAAYKEAGKYRIPGFRPGKAPRNILDNHFGGPEYFLAQATDELVRRTAPVAVDELGFVALGSPEFKEPGLVAESEAFEYSFTLDVTPELELSSYDAIQIELPNPEPTAEEIQAQLDALRDYYVVEDEDGNKVLPELTDAWVKETLEFESIDELNTRIYESILEQKSQDLPALKEYQSSAAIAQRLVGEVPEEMVKQTEQDNYKDLFQSLQNQRISLDVYLQNSGLTPENFRDSMHQQAHQSAAIALALDALGRHLGLSASDDEVKEEFVKSGAKDPEELLKSWKANGRLSEVRRGLVRIKAANHVFDTAEIFEPGTLYPLEADSDDHGTDDQDPDKKDSGDKPADEKKPAKKKAAKKDDKTDQSKPVKTKTEKASKDDKTDKVDTNKKTSAKAKSVKIDSNKQSEPKKKTKAKD